MQSWETLVSQQRHPTTATKTNSVIMEREMARDGWVERKEALLQSNRADKGGVK